MIDYSLAASIMCDWTVETPAADRHYLVVAMTNVRHLGRRIRRRRSLALTNAFRWNAGMVTGA